MTSLPRTDPAERAALFLAGALPPAEHAAADVDADAHFRAEVLTLGAAVEALADSAASEPPPASVRAILLARIASAPRDHGVPSVITSHAKLGRWRPGPGTGIETRLLHLDRDRGRFAALYRMAPGARFAGHPHDGYEEMLVLDGEMTDGNQTLKAGDYQFASAGSIHGEMTTERGCVVFLTAPLAALTS